VLHTHTHTCTLYIILHLYYILAGSRGHVFLSFFSCSDFFFRSIIYYIVIVIYYYYYYYCVVSARASPARSFSNYRVTFGRMLQRVCVHTKQPSSSASDCVVYDIRARSRSFVSACDLRPTIMRTIIIVFIYHTAQSRCLLLLLLYPSPVYNMMMPTRQTRRPLFEIAPCVRVSHAVRYLTLHRIGFIV